MHFVLFISGSQCLLILSGSLLLLFNVISLNLSHGKKSSTSLQRLKYFPFAVQKIQLCKLCLLVVMPFLGWKYSYDRAILRGSYYWSSEDKY